MECTFSNLWILTRLVASLYYSQFSFKPLEFFGFTVSLVSSIVKPSFTYTVKPNSHISIVIGSTKFGDHIEEMIGKRPSLFYRISWMYIVPVITLVRLIFFIYWWINSLLEISLIIYRYTIAKQRYRVSFYSQFFNTNPWSTPITIRILGGVKWWAGV